MTQRPFGEFLTVVHGPNGSGKTQIMCALSWVLGGARQVADPVWSQCAGAQLVVRTASGSNVEVFRAFSQRFHASIKVIGQSKTFFADEATFASSLLEVLGIPPRVWTASRGGATPVYMSVLLPAFAVDQDKGWTMPYVPYASKLFVEDQFEEVSRLVLGLEAKRSPERDVQRSELQSNLEVAENQVGVLSRTVESLVRDAGAIEDLDLNRLRASHARLTHDLAQFEDAASAAIQTDYVLQRQLIEARSVYDELEAKLLEARRYRDTLQRLMQEADGDLNVVGSNEIAADAFRRFCGNTSCQFFQGHDVATSYGRRLLYLKDQLKDITTAMSSADGSIALLEARSREQLERLSGMRREYQATVQAKLGDRVAAGLKSVSGELAKVSSALAFAEQINGRIAARENQMHQMERLREDVRRHDQVRTRASARVSEVRQAVQDALLNWLQVLKTGDIGDVSVDAGFAVCINGKRLSDVHGPSGSSRTRLVLACHATRLQVSLAEGGNHPGFLLFDAPKQHEIEPAHFRSYLDTLRTLQVIGGGTIQVVMSSRGDVATDERDAVWEPQFQSARRGSKKFFLGSTSD